MDESLEREFSKNANDTTRDDHCSDRDGAVSHVHVMLCHTWVVTRAENKSN